MIEVKPASGVGLAEPLRLLEEFLREGEPVPADFVWRLRRAVEAGELEVLVAWAARRVVGVAVLAYRLSVLGAEASAGPCSKPLRGAAGCAASPTWRRRSRTK